MTFKWYKERFSTQCPVPATYRFTQARQLLQTTFLLVPTLALYIADPSHLSCYDAQSFLYTPKTIPDANFSDTFQRFCCYTFQYVLILLYLQKNMEAHKTGSTSHVAREFLTTIIHISVRWKWFLPVRCYHHCWVTLCELLNKSACWKAYLLRFLVARFWHLTKLPVPLCSVCYTYFKG